MCICSVYVVLHIVDENSFFWGKLIRFNQAQIELRPIAVWIENFKN